jgi:putative transposase
MSYGFSNGYKIRDQGGLHFLTFTTVGWIDLFSRKQYRDIFIENLQYCRKHKSLQVGAYVIMSNHIHLIVQCGRERLSDTVRDLKSYTAKKCIETIKAEPESRRDWLIYMFQYYANVTNRNTDFKIWANDNHPEQITSKDFLMSKLNYTHENPVRAGLVAKPEDYLYSSAANYVHGKGLCDIDFLF